MIIIIMISIVSIIVLYRVLAVFGLTGLCRFFGFVPHFGFRVVSGLGFRVRCDHPLPFFAETCGPRSRNACLPKPSSA